MREASWLKQHFFKTSLLLIVLGAVCFIPAETTYAQNNPFHSVIVLSQAEGVGATKIESKAQAYFNLNLKIWSDYWDAVADLPRGAMIVRVWTGAPNYRHEEIDEGQWRTIAMNVTSIVYIIPKGGTSNSPPDR